MCIWECVCLLWVRGVMETGLILFTVFSQSFTKEEVRARRLGRGV